MTKSGNQTEKGKAFEFACAKAIFERVPSCITAKIQESPQLATAKKFYDLLEQEEKQNYQNGALAAVKIIDRLEPNLFSGIDNLIIEIQPDSSGISGDVRDVICSRGRRWQIGLSCKHNHEAVKHSRLSDKIDFGKEWFEKKCSSIYFDDVEKVFLPLREMKDFSISLKNGHCALWSEIPNKEDSCYVPVLKAFMKELKRLDKDNPGEIPELLIRYLIGRNDFYKVIMNDSRHFTQIETININGTLNRSCGKKRALLDAPVLKMPRKFYEIDFKEGSKNTIVVVCDQGWNISMRIHNASSKVEPSLKFDVQLISMPTSILTQIEPW